MSAVGRRVIALAATARTARDLQHAVVDALRPIAGFDWYAFVLTDPTTAVGASPLADVPRLDELPGLIRRKYLTRINRWTALSGPASLLGATGGAPERSLFWREQLHGYGVVDVASMVFRDGHGCWGFLDLWRTGAAPGFTTAELAGLGEVMVPVTRGLRRAVAATFAQPHPPVPRPGPVVLTLSTGLDVIGQTPATADYLRALLPAVPPRSPVPAGAYNVAAQLLAVEAGIDDGPPSARVHLADRAWLTMRAARLGRDAIAVSIEDTTAADRLDLFGRAFGLTARERDVLGWLATGADTREAAARMFVSTHTVQDHLKSIFAKTGTHSRRALLAALLGA
jgi:DNA-binding CsgD family transcriptional regulator